MRFLAVFLFGLALTAHVGAQSRPRVSEATIIGVGRFRGRISGRIIFTQRDCAAPVIINGIVNGLPVGLHGMHVHERHNGVHHEHKHGVTAGHYNPFKTAHGAPEDKERHVGDLGNVQSLAAQPAPITYIRKVDPVISLCPGVRGVNLHAIFIHEFEDDLGRGGTLESLVTGNSGPPIAVGVIMPRAL